MSQPIELEFISSTSPSYKINIRELYFPGYKGKTGILADHISYITLLEQGELYYQDMNNKYHYFYVRDGFLEVIHNKIVHNKIVVVSDSISKGEDLDGIEIKARLDEVRKTIKASLNRETDITPENLDKALIEEKELKTQLEIAKKARD